MKERADRMKKGGETVFEIIKQTFKEFSEDDYLRYVDGKPRLDGVTSFLDSRGIALPVGDFDDPVDSHRQMMPAIIARSSSSITPDRVASAKIMCSSSAVSWRRSIFASLSLRIAALISSGAISTNSPSETS